jgi:hypothetical protein
MLSTSNSKGQQQDDDDELGVSNRTAHDIKYPHIQEFSELIQDLSIKDLEALLTPFQKKFATSLWEAENYGGSTEKCKKRLEDLYGPKWFQFVPFKDHFLGLRSYYESVLIADHKRQWDTHRKIATLNQESNV